MTDHSALLRAHGIQVTAQRLAVLRVVEGRPHITADAVADVVRAEIGAISLQSVYDALALLVAQRIIRRIQPSGSPARFEARVGDNHHHLICRSCGRVVDVDCAAGAAPCLAPIDGRGYEIDEAEVAYWGRCPDCLDQSGSAASGDLASAAPSGRRRKAHPKSASATPRRRTRNSRSNPRPTRRTSRG